MPSWPKDNNEIADRKASRYAIQDLQELFCKAERNRGSLFTRWSRSRSKNSVVPQIQPCRRIQGLSCRVVAHGKVSAVCLNLEGRCQCVGMCWQ